MGWILGTELQETKVPNKLRCIHLRGLVTVSSSFQLIFFDESTNNNDDFIKVSITSSNGESFLLIGET